MSDGKNVFDVKVAWIDLVKSALWPIAICIFLVSISGSISRLIDYVPMLAEKASVVEVGDIRLELSEDIARSASSLVKSHLSELNSEQIEILFDSHDGSDLLGRNPEGEQIFLWSGINTANYYCEDNKKYSELGKLNELGLISASKNPRTVEEKIFLFKELNCISFRLTEEGVLVREFLLKIVSDLFRQVSGNL